MKLLEYIKSKLDYTFKVIKEPNNKKHSIYIFANFKLKKPSNTKEKNN